MRNKIGILASCISVFVLGLFISAIVAAQTGDLKIIKAGTLIDPATSTIKTNVFIKIRDGRIESIEPAGALPKDAEVIDLSDKFVLPGLMDAHVHLSAALPYKRSGLAGYYANNSSGFRALTAANNARLFLQNGFTVVKEIGNDANYATADVIKAIRSGYFDGPEIVYAGKIIAPFGGQSAGVAPEAGDIWRFEYLDADSADEIRKAVRQNIYYGANTIKLVSSPEITSYYDVDEIRAAVDEAGKHGFKVAVHSLGGQGATNAILGGAASIEHGFDLTNEQLEMMKTRGTVLVGTDLWIDNLEAYGLPPVFAETIFNSTIDRLKRADKLGVKMAYGTDVIMEIPGMNRVQTSNLVLKSWKKAGVPAMKTLQAMTVNAAELMSMGKSRGRLEKGYIADIVAVGKNPLEDVENLSDVAFVMKDGKTIVLK
ncbi:MAG: amidohydrolase family protein [Pyrinomonadaceae bacterium]